MNLSMRRATVNDLPVLDKVCAQAGHEYLGGCLVKWLSETGVYTYLLEDESPFAFVSVGPGEDLGALPAKGKRGQILGWWVAPDRRYLGHGRKLLVHGLTVLRRQMVDVAQIWMRSDDPRACQIVIKTGFDDVNAEKLLNTSSGVQKLCCYEKNIEDYF